MVMKILFGKVIDTISIQSSVLKPTKIIIFIYFII